MGMKKGYFFTLDAILGMFILFAGLMLLSNMYSSSQPRAQISYYSEDIISLLAEIHVDELNNSYLEMLIANGNITDMENTILEQIGIFYVTNKTNLAKALAENITYELVPERYSISFLVGDDVIYSETRSGSSELVTYKSMITGIEKSRPIKGTAARIFLQQVRTTISTDYAFIGGFVGQGNVSVFLRDVPPDANVTEIYLEADAADDFSLYINGIHCDDFVVSLENMSADSWDITHCNYSVIKGMDNNLTFIFDADINRSFFGGGFIKMSYFTKNIILRNTSSHRYEFPGIEGIVNLYDGFDIPGELNYMRIYLHYLANHSNISANTFYLTIGNMTVYRDNTSNTTMSVHLNNSYISSILNYSLISNQTVPLRLGFENISFDQIITDMGNGDVVAITDVSGSMQWEFTSTNAGTERFCKNMDLNKEDSMRLAVGKCILKTFAHDILYNITGNRVGMVTYASGVRDTVFLDTNLTRLDDAANLFYASGATCTSCGVVEASRLLEETRPVDLLAKRWTYTNDFQSVDPINWTQVKYDDANWSEGYLLFGHGTESDYYTGNVINADLWDMPQDIPAPVDFTSGIYSIANTFGFMTVTSTAYPLMNQYFTGPSINGWTGVGSVSTSQTSIIFTDDFEDGNLNGWSLDSGRCSWFSWSAPNADASAQSSLSAGSFGARMRCGDDDDDSAGSGNTDANDPAMTLALDLSAYQNVRLTYSRAGYAEGSDTHDSGEDFRSEWSTNGFAATNQLENIEIRNGNLEDFSGDPIWGTVSYDLPAGALDANFELRFSKDSSWDGEQAFLDDITIENIIANNFGLDDFWMVNGSLGSVGYLRQEFSSPTSTPHNADLYLVHSINYSMFTAADAWCNLTHPGGETTVWTEHWDLSSLPAEGPIIENIDITAMITSSTFNYVLECGANVSGGSIVAFDNITLGINWTNDGNDGWDWQQGVYGYAGNVEFYANSSGNLEIVCTESANDASGSFGIQVEVTQEMIDAMNSPGGQAWLSFDYRWDARDNGGSVFEDTDEVWVKGYWQSPLSGIYYLGSETSGVDGDIGNEIWSADDPDDEKFGHYAKEISSWIDNGPGFYYLALGGRLQRSSSNEFGAFSFDNVQLAFTNNSGNTFYRNMFWINSMSNLHNPITLSVTTDDGADVYLNDVLIDSYLGAQASRSIPVVPGDFKRGENVLAVKLKNADDDSRLNVDFRANITDRLKAMLIMSDGESNDCVGQFGTGTDASCNDCGGRGCCPGSDGIIDEPCPSISQFSTCGWSDEYRYSAEQLVNLSCFYARVRNMSIYAVAFGDVAQCGKIALNLSALCDPAYTAKEPHYFESDNPEGLSQIYGQIANQLRLAFSVRRSQVISFDGDWEKSYIYPDSYIFLNYTANIKPVVHGEVPIFMETDDFNGCTYNVSIPSQLRVYEANLLSYSGEHWTDYVAVNNSMGRMVAFNLSRFNPIYANLGDPFPIPIPGNFFASGEVNQISVSTGDNIMNSTECSKNTTLVYTGLINVINHTMPYSSVRANATGCNWTVEHIMGYNFSISVPNTYTGAKRCEFTNSSHDTSGFDTDDSYDWAMYNFLKHLDIDSDGRVFINLNEEDFIVSSKIIRDVPYLWGPTIAEVRVWQ